MKGIKKETIIETEVEMQNRKERKKIERDEKKERERVFVRVKIERERIRKKNIPGIYAASIFFNTQK